MFPIGTIYYKRSFKLVRWIWIFKQNSLETCGFLDNFLFPDNGNLWIAIIILLSWFLAFLCHYAVQALRNLLPCRLYVSSSLSSFTCTSDFHISLLVKVPYPWQRGAMVITTAELHSTKRRFAMVKISFVSQPYHKNNSLSLSSSSSLLLKLPTALKVLRASKPCVPSQCDGSHHLFLFTTFFWLSFKFLTKPPSIYKYEQK